MATPGNLPRHIYLLPATSASNKGCFGQVRRARHDIDGGIYAIKQIQVEKSLKHLIRVNALLREVENLRKLTSPNVVRYHYSWWEGPNLSKYVSDRSTSIDEDELPFHPTDFLYILTEWFDTDLKRWLFKFPTKESRVPYLSNIFKDVCTGLNVVHESGLIHRDIKPDNIFGMPRGSNFIWKIGDFGFSVKDHDSDTPRGAEVYMAPEVLWPQNEQNTKASDVYSTGLVFLELIHPMEEKVRRQLFSDLALKKITVEEVVTSFDSQKPQENNALLGMLQYDADKRLAISEIQALFEGTSSRPSGVRLPFSAGDVVAKECAPFWFSRQPCKRSVDREVLLGELEDHFLANVTTVVVGLGGTGKSELLKQFSVQCWKKNRNCLWLDAFALNFLLASTESALKFMSIERRGRNPADCLKSLMRVLPSVFPTLIVLDNLDHLYDEVAEVVTAFNNQQPDIPSPVFIITSRNHDLIAEFGANKLDVGVLSDNEAMTLVSYNLTHDEDEFQRGKLCSVLQNFPLALGQACAYIAFRQQSSPKGFSIQQYLRMFEEESRRVELLQYHLPTQHEYILSTWTVWSLSLKHVQSHEELGPIVEGLFQQWCYAVDPNGKPLQLIVNFHTDWTQMQQSLQVPNPNTRSPVFPIDHQIRKMYLLDPCNPFSEKIKGRPIKRTREELRTTCLQLQWYREGGDEPDLLDDPRAVARAILLLRNFSICSVDLHYDTRYGSADMQFVFVNRLLLEVMDLQSMMEGSRDSILQEICTTLLNPIFRAWSLRNTTHFGIRAEIVNQMGKRFIADHKLLQQFPDIISHLMYDSLPGSHPLPFPTVKHLAAASFQALDTNHEAAVALRFYECLLWFQQHSKSKERNEEEVRRLVALFNDHLSEIPNNHILCHNVAALVVQFLYHDLVPSQMWEHDDPSDLSNTVLHALAQMRLVLNASNVESRSTIDEVLSMLCLKHRLPFAAIESFSLRELFDGNRLISPAAASTVQMFESNCPVNNQDRCSLPLNFLNELREAADRNAGNLPTSLIQKVFKCIIYHAEGVEGVQSSRMMDQLATRKNHDELREAALEAIQAADGFCLDGNHKAGYSLLSAACRYQLLLFEEERYTDCAAILGALPPLSKYSQFFEDPDIISNRIETMMEMFIAKGIRTEQISKSLARPEEDTATQCIEKESTALLQSTTSDVLSNVPIDIPSVAGNSEGVNRYPWFTVSDGLWDAKDFEAWKLQFLQEVDGISNQAGADFALAKAGEYVFYIFDEEDDEGRLNEIPPEIFSWGYCLILHHDRAVPSYWGKMKKWLLGFISCLSQNSEGQKSLLHSFASSASEFSSLELQRGTEYKTNVDRLTTYLLFLYSLFVCINTFEYPEASIVLSELVGLQDETCPRNSLSTLFDTLDKFFPFNLTNTGSKILSHLFRELLTLFWRYSKMDSSNVDYSRFFIFLDVWINAVAASDNLRRRSRVIFDLVSSVLNRNEGVKALFGFPKDTLNFIRIAKELLYAQHFVDAMKLYRLVLHSEEQREKKLEVKGEISQLLQDLISTDNRLSIATLCKRAQPLLVVLLQVNLTDNGENDKVKIRKLVDICFQTFGDVGSASTIYEFGVALSRIECDKLVHRDLLEDVTNRIIRCLRVRCKKQIAAVKREMVRVLRYKEVEGTMRSWYIQQVQGMLTEFGVNIGVPNQVATKDQGITGESSDSDFDSADEEGYELELD